MSCRVGLSRWVALAACGVAVAGCFKPNPQTQANCLQLGTCECIQKSDCAAPLDCVDGVCTNLHPDGGGLLGAPCRQGPDCASGMCLPRGPGNGGICTQACAPDAGACPREWDCKASSSSAPFVCSPPFDSLCLPCNQDSDCNTTGDLCLGIAGRRACGRDCSAAPCPDGYACSQVATDAGPRAQCLPAAGTCECTDVTVGLARACSHANGFGTCFGRQLCQADGGWTGCDARVASREVCDGLDNDCNGLTDQNDPGLDVSGLPANPPYPNCRKGTGGPCLGTWECGAGDAGAVGWTCNARDPVPEVCNGIDDDCDGVVDNGFVNDAGQYVSVHDCGACGDDCTAALLNLATDGGVVLPGAAACELLAGAPTCVPLLCAHGAYLYPPAAPQLCELAVSSSCRPCVSDSDCAVSGDKCVTFGSDPGTACAQSCDPASVYGGCQGQVGTQDCCPAGYTCQASAGTKLCIPQGNSCQCNPGRVGATRSCVKSFAISACLGLETCTADAGWSGCDTAKTIAEVCDGKDNDCDGVADEPFINTKGSGTYDTDQHCGNCLTDCRAEWSPTIQHAIGGCDAGPGRPPACAIFQCTSSTVAGGGTCRQSSDCGNGRFCAAPFYQCVRACSSAADCAGQPCVGGFCSRNCGSDSDCVSSFGAPSSCTGGLCSVGYTWVDADKDPTNGCECPSSQGQVDAPDIYPTYPDAGLPYPDRNCDGVNGVVATSLFVWSGSPSSQGTRASPFRTIREALAAYNPAVHTAILVAEGDYVEQVVLRNGVKLYGGYSPDFSRRDVVSLPTLIEGPEPDFTQANPTLGSVNAVGITQAAVLAGFTVRGYDVTFRPAGGRPGKSSYAIYVRDSTAALTISDNHLYGGRGGDGAEGAPGGAGGNGGSGGSGHNSVECKSAGCDNESLGGGAAGANGACFSAGGNPGASSAGGGGFQAQQPYTSTVGGNGLGGFNGSYQHTDPSQNSLCKYDCVIPTGGLNGNPAQNGGDGVARSPGGGCGQAIGSVAVGEWQAGLASDGSPGTPGTGGGGGGAGGGVVNQNVGTGCTVGNPVGDLGATGGGGGAGGCGGSGGTHGGAGGGSFALFIYFSGAPSFPLIQGNLIDLGAGGFGGNGGPGGYGGVGGPGGEAGVGLDPAWCAGNGGHGGRGGNGGAGSGGGGGCGGVAFGLAGNQLGGTNYAAANAFNGLPAGASGSPGAGGASPAGASFSGGSGVSGAVGTVHGY